MRQSLSYLIVLLCFVLPFAAACTLHADSDAAADPAPTSEPEVDSTAEALKQAWCCRFTNLADQELAITLNTNAVLAHGACLSAALAIVPAVKHLSVRRGAC